MASVVGQGMERAAAHLSRWRTADVIFGISLLAGLALSYFWPLSLGLPRDSLVLHLIGAPLLLGGGAIIVLSKKALLSHGQPSEPRQPTTRIVTGGPYGYSRNPMYTGLALCFAGLGVAIDKPWLLIVLPFTLLAVYRLLIRPEEHYLEGRFGEAFLAYKKAVRRWL